MKKPREATEVSARQEGELQMEKKQLLEMIEQLKPYIPLTSYKSVVGQIRVGDLKGAWTGIIRLRGRVRANE